MGGAVLRNRPPSGWGVIGEEETAAAPRDVAWRGDTNHHLDGATGTGEEEMVVAPFEVARRGAAVHHPDGVAFDGDTEGY